MAVTHARKQEQLNELLDMFGKSKTVIFSDYRGVDVASLSKLRKELLKAGAEGKVAKKTLMHIAAKEKGIPEIDKKFMEGPVLAMFAYEDALSGIKILYKFAKTNEKFKMLGGIIDGKVVGPEIVKAYATLPSREELLAKFMGSASSPTQKVVGLLSNLMASFVRTLDGVAKKQAGV
jgi:large subunit ribosomal protein L10